MPNNFATYIANEFGDFVGKTIAKIRPLTDTELKDLYWQGEEGFVIIFTDGSCLIPSQDPEGNGAGWLFAANVTRTK